MRTYEGRGLRFRALLFAGIAVAAISTFIVLHSADEGRVGYQAGTYWTWQVTRSDLDPMTENVLSSSSYQQTLEYIGEAERDGYECAVLKLTTEGREGYELLFRVVGGNEIRELGSESYTENEQLVAAYRYSTPLLYMKLPMEVGARVSDASEVSGYDNATGVRSIAMFETRVVEVLGKETLLSPAKLECYMLRIRGSSAGKMSAVTTSEILVSYEENVWYSPEIGEVVKSVSRTTTAVITPLATSVTKTLEERVLVSYHAR